jgi:hypothetical protein
VKRERERERKREREREREREKAHGAIRAWDAGAAYLVRERLLKLLARNTAWRSDPLRGRRWLG